MSGIRNPLFIAGLRIAGLLILFFVFVCFRREGDTKLGAQNPRSESAASQDANRFGDLLLRNYPEALDAASQSEISAALKEYGQASNIVWRMNATRTTLTSQ